MLFDLYHVQIMNGDLIRRLEECKDVIGHIHTAGNPGRGELDDNQEINFRGDACGSCVDIGYKGYVGHEFIPTRDPFAGLKQAVASATCELASTRRCTKSLAACVTLPTAGRGRVRTSATFVPVGPVRTRPPTAASTG